MIGIFRHAKAVAGEDEMMRPLAQEGINQAKAMQKRVEVSWDVLLCSEAVRTQQTGRILVDIVPEVIEGLYIGFYPSEDYIQNLLQVIQPYWQVDDNVLIVTHQPMICPLLTAITGKSLSTDVSSGEGVIINPDTQAYQWYKR